MSAADLLLAQARAARAAGDPGRALLLCRQAVAADARHATALAELATLCADTSNFDEAATRFLQVCELTGWRDPQARRNLLATLVQIASGGRGVFQLSERGRAYRANAGEVAAPAAHAAHGAPRVSVIVADTRGGQALHDAIARIAQQTYPHIEMVIASSGPPAALAAAPANLRHLVLPGASNAVAFNTAARAASGDYLQFLGGRDGLEPDAIATLVSAVANSGQALAFSRVVMVGAQGEALDRFAHPAVFDAACSQSAIDWHETRSFGFIADNPAVAAGNLFVARPLFVATGGFADLRHQYLWDFFLRANLRAEPLFVPDAVYRHCPDTLALSPGELQERLREALPMLSRFIEEAFTVASDNKWAPTYRNWGPQFVVRLLGSPIGELVTPARLRQLVGDLVGTAAT